MTFRELFSRTRYQVGILLDFPELLVFLLINMMGRDGGILRLYF
jgi:hypothetical protein